MSLFDILKKDEAEKIISESHEYASERLTNFLESYAPWVVVDKLKAKDLTEEDFNWFKIQISDAYREGYEAALTIPERSEK